MGRYIIKGGNKINGKVRINGAKNSCLPIMAASVLNGSTSKIIDVPYIKDIAVMIEILKYLGATVARTKEALYIDTSKINNCEVPEYLMRSMRSSIFLMGPILSRFGKVKVSYPGGCDIGPRPVDLHLRGLRLLGANIVEKHGYIEAEASKLKGNEIHLDYPSVGATENLMMAAVLAKGITIIRNSAKEPEIVDLQNFLNGMGAQVKGAGTDTIKIKGVANLKDVEHTVIPDRIAAGTFLIAGAITGGKIHLQNVIKEHLDSVIAKLKETGCKITLGDNYIKLDGANPIKPANVIRTLPYPGFPTDLQAPMMALMTISDNVTVLTETVFENRFKHVDELRRMGANIKINGNTAVIEGVKKLNGTYVEAKDLRAGAALILAGLAAKGTTIVTGIHSIERGYERIEKKLKNVGADIVKVDNL
ncbi:MAG TPA: UDP-N-acetylglucosamine 1-carboxyvinyltransferase [Thermoanaerobacterales bacterium]|nr:UDP-N-acetylglucosamine 1-carboxyvinyltransferase [Thermoanaerobacterales bacterium]